MTDIIIMILSTIGAIFILLAAVGVVRMPDIYLRISVTTKAATLGVGLVLVAASVYFADMSVTSRVIAIICFLFLTAPISAHMIGRAAYFTGTRLWKRSTMDDLEGKYDQNKSGRTDDEPEETKGTPKS